MFLYVFLLRNVLRTMALFTFSIQTLRHHLHGICAQNDMSYKLKFQVRCFTMNVLRRPFKKLKGDCVFAGVNAFQ